MIRVQGLAAFYLACCVGVVACTPSNVNPPPPDATDAWAPPVLEGGAIHSYTCPIRDGGAAWSCQDGLTTPVGTCARLGCIPVGP